MRVCHITSVHKNTDVRILEKQCVSLVNAGYEVYLIAPGKSYKYKGVNIMEVPLPKNKWERFFKTTKMVYREALKLNADIYQIHDPELLYCGLKLKKHNKQVIFDSHEDVSAQILQKLYIPTHALRCMVSFIYSYIEKFVVSRLDGVIAATTHVADKMHKYNKNTTLITNYPIVGDEKKF